MTERGDAILEELLAWTRFAYRQQLVDALEAALRNPKHFQAYELTDGTRTQGQVAQDAGVTQQTVSNLWTKWRRMGLVTERGGRVCHLQRPSDVGLQEPTSIE